MADTLKTVPERDIHYYRQRHRNRVFSDIAAYFAEEAKERGIRKSDIAKSLKRDPAQVTRWLSAPSNLTLDTISDLLLVLGAEIDCRIVRFKDRPKPNALHPLLARISGSLPRVDITSHTPSDSITTAPTSGTNISTANLKLESV